MEALIFCCFLLYALQPAGHTNQSFLGAFLKEYFVITRPGVAGPVPRTVS